MAYDQRGERDYVVQDAGRGRDGVPEGVFIRGRGKSKSLLHFVILVFDVLSSCFKHRRKQRALGGYPSG